MHWNVYYHNVNLDEIKVINVLGHSGFLKEVRAHMQTCNSKDEFAEKVRRSLFYYFGSKCEYEVLISPWCGTRGGREIKVDIFRQVMNNYDHFINYLWSCRGNAVEE